MRTAAFLPWPLPLSHPAAVDFAAGEPSSVCSSKHTIIHIMAKGFPLRVCLFIVVFGEQGYCISLKECIYLFIFDRTLFVSSGSADNEIWKGCSVGSFDRFLLVTWRLA